MAPASKRVALVLAGALLTVPVAAVRLDLTPEEQTKCDEEGGCLVVTERWRLRGLARAAFDHGRSSKSCPNTT